jgi:hypothetical protein
MFIWIPWCMCSRLLEYSLTPVYIYNTIKSPEAHFAFPADDVTRIEDFMKVQMLAAYLYSFHTVVQRTKYSCFLAISPDFLLASYFPVRLRSADLKLLRKSTCQISLFSTSYSTKDLKNLSKLNTFRKNTSFYLSHTHSVSIWKLRILKLRTE